MLRAALLTTVCSTGLLPGQKSQDEFFGLDKLWDIHIELTRDDWVGMYPGKSKSSTRLFGKYPYKKAKVTIGAHTLPDVAVRMKGNATFMANGGTLKKSLKLDFNRHAPDRRFLGMGKLNLQCNALDRTQIKEAVSYRIYRDCGVHAGRTAFARVFLTLQGACDKAYLGLYTAVEQVDQRFAKRTVGGGLILKPDGETLVYLGDAWNKEYDAAYHPKSKVTKALAAPLLRTASLFDEPDDAAFGKAIADVMDVPSMLRYTAATAILINTDSPLTVPDNYYLIVSKRTKKVTWIPWDMNWSFGEYGNITRTPTLDLSVRRPTLKAVFRRVLEHDRFRDQYLATVKKYIEGPASAAAMRKALQTVHATVKDALAMESKRPKIVTDSGRELGGQRSRHPALRGRDGDTFAALLEWAGKRERSVRDQLAGESEGRSARNVWGPNARTIRGAHLRDALADGKEELRESDRAATLKKTFAALDADASKTLDRDELRPALRRAWRKEPRTPTNRRDPSAARARTLLTMLDANGDGAIDGDEWTSRVSTWWTRYWDRDGDGTLSAKELGRSK